MVRKCLHKISLTLEKKLQFSLKLINKLKQVLSIKSYNSVNNLKFQSILIDRKIVYIAVTVRINLCHFHKNI